MYWHQSNGPNRIQDLSLCFDQPETITGFCGWIVKQCPHLVRLNWFHDVEDLNTPIELVY